MRTNKRSIERQLATAFFNLSSIQMFYYDDPLEHREIIVNHIAELMVNMYGLVDLMNIQDEELKREFDKITKRNEEYEKEEQQKEIK